MKKKIVIGLFLFILLVGLTGCGSSDTKKTSSNSDTTSYSSKLSTEELFTERDLEQTADTTNAKTYIVSNSEDITITEEGVYIITGNANNVSIIINTDDESKVQLVLENLTITNETEPCIYVKNADKVFFTTTGTNNLSVTGTFTTDGTTNLDAVIFSKDDLVINGTGTLNISSTDNGITSKDDLKITGGTITIKCTNDGIEANNSIAIKDADITINSKKDGIHAEYDDDETVGYIYIVGGTINITASDDAINAGAKSSAFTPTIEINNGYITINMGQGDTDAVDSNGNIIMNGGTLDITAQSPFDYDRTAKYNGGIIIVNGEETNKITNQMMGNQMNQGGRR